MRSVGASVVRSTIDGMMVMVILVMGALAYGVIVVATVAIRLVFLPAVWRGQTSGLREQVWSAFRPAG